MNFSVVKKRKVDVQHQGSEMPVRQQLIELLSSPSYWIICLAGSLVMMGYFAPTGFLVGMISSFKIIMGLFLVKIIY